MKYFAQWVSVEGEIKEGDWYTSPYGVEKCFRRANDTSHKAQYPLSYEFYDQKYVKKVKLFLCSRDIQVGDEVQYSRADLENVPGVITDQEDIEICKEFEGFKVIGEILTPGIKEGQKFTEKQVEYLTLK